jgi:hypothetical protein
MTVQTNLPPIPSTNSSDATRAFFDNYFTAPIFLPSNEVDAVVGFFKKRGFSETAANSTSIVLLQQSKIDEVNIFDLLDTLSALTEIQINSVVAEVLNYNRQKTSSLGLRQTPQEDLLEKRNILL